MPGSLGRLQMSLSQQQEQHDPCHMHRRADHVRATEPGVAAPVGGETRGSCVVLRSPRCLQLIADSAQAERETPCGACPRARIESARARARGRSHLHPYQTAHPPGKHAHLLYTHALCLWICTCP
ncbi:hypothetical protein PHYPO_G00143200 [Pangasianodon hypophthalmus]|uniref:Uncharacterized protein n=1 Tax=Pangasianodon hypophthalmus TaxID=310915 RepID=A0A5N5KEE6_PANHP|nr:hypothetical protein PHYPO_G00143200 [Pangasianodon hypophthalmus]